MTIFCCLIGRPLQEKLLGHLGVVLYEYLGEEYPEVLGSILGGLKVSRVSFKIAHKKKSPGAKSRLSCPG